MEEAFERCEVRVGVSSERTELDFLRGISAYGLVELVTHEIGCPFSESFEMERARGGVQERESEMLPVNSLDCEEDSKYKVCWFDILLKSTQLFK